MKIGFIGAGQMAMAIMKGILNSKNGNKNKIFTTDIVDKSMETKNLGITWLNSNEEVVKKAEIIILCVKPNQIENVLKQIEHVLSSEKLIISIAAGIEIKQMKKVLKNHDKISRVMPNVNCLCQSAACAYSLYQDNSKDSTVIEEIFSSVGTISKVPESSLDAVTGLSGSGPAYVFQFIEALSDAGVLNGLPRDISTQLAIQTVYGSCKMLIETKNHPAVSKWMVTSPGGTTIEGLKNLEEGNFNAVVMKAVSEATKKSIKLRSKI
eukprot:gene7629-11951_t